MKLFDLKESIQVIFVSLFVGLILSYPSFNSIVFLKYTMLYLISLLGKLFIIKRVSFINGLNSEFKVFIPSVIFSLFLLLYGIKIPIPGYFSFASFKFGRYKFLSKRPSVNEIGKIVVKGSVFNLVIAFFGVIFELRELITVNLLQILTSLLPFDPFEGGAVFFYDYFVWIALMMLSLIILIFG